MWNMNKENIITLGLRDRRDKEREQNIKNGSNHIKFIFIENGRGSLALLTSTINFNICKYCNGKLANQHLDCRGEESMGD